MLNVSYHTYVNHAFFNVCVTYGLTSRVLNVCLTYVVHVLSSNICETYVAQLAVYAALLNRIRTGDQTKKDIEILSSRIVTTEDVSKLLHIFPVKRDWDLHNTELIRLLILIRLDDLWMVQNGLFISLSWQVKTEICLLHV